MFRVVGVGAREEISVTTQSILLGGHLRVGFGDNIYYRKGELVKSNAQLVARVVCIGWELGWEIASQDEARQMLEIPRLEK
jgi:3-keto-5-aminohexanoate cleavage enzyme